MNDTISMDKSGRIVLPKPVREELQLSAGDELEMEVSRERIVLRPARPKRRLYKKHGIWVLDTGTPLSPQVVTETIRQLREERKDWALGKRP